MQWRNISIKWKIFTLALAGPVVIAVIFSWQRAADIRSHAEQAMVEKSKAIVQMAEATRTEMAQKLQMGVIVPLDKLDPSKILEAVPVVTAMKTAALNAQQSNYQFRAPKVNPRNPANEPTPLELEVLEELKRERSSEKILITNTEIRYFKPIVLTEDCMFCHGAPAGKLDPTGGVMEGWKIGEIHGAFEIISSMEATNKQVKSTIFSIALWTMVILAFCCVLSWLLLNSNIVKPLQYSSNEIKKIAGKDLTGRIQASGNDEFGTISRALQDMKEQLHTVIIAIIKGADRLDERSQDLSSSASQLSSNSDEMNSRSISVAAAAEEMSSNMSSVAAATEEASTNIALVATATEGMSQTFSEITKNTKSAQNITTNAVHEALSASAKVDELGAAASRIDKVTETITEISDQTNLLALNATIEAARAGEAGKGFAVVANEIKELAKQTAAATGEIKTQINGIQTSTSETIRQIEQITSVINEVNDIVTVIVDAVEEQNQATREIAENISQATLGIQEVTENVSQSSAVADEVAQDIHKVSTNANEVAGQSGHMQQSAQELLQLAKELRNLTGEFKV
ncbi:MAG: methyl-accepting chemotaxis protein [Desulfopila sp.]|jgi:methyl-accepting chemotaxis protein|nr:methyl-accepting chemotaxis protein [Desulfopila sp.]